MASRIRLRVIESSGTLCGKCSRSMIMQGQGGMRVICNAMRGGSEPLLITHRVDTCTRFIEANQPERYDLEKIAWVLDVNRSGTRVGFAAPGSTRHQELVDG